MSYTILSEASNVRVQEVDAGIKNKFVWAWLDREIDIAIANVKDKNENLVTRSRKFKLSEFIKKVDVPGKAICALYDTGRTWDSTCQGPTCTWIPFDDIRDIFVMFAKLPQ